MTDLAIQGTAFGKLKAEYVTSAERTRDSVAFKGTHFQMGQHQPIRVSEAKR